MTVINKMTINQTMNALCNVTLHENNYSKNKAFLKALNEFDGFKIDHKSIIIC